MDGITLEERIKLGNFITNSQKLLYFNQVWSDYNEESTSITEYDRPLLIDVVNTIIHGLTELSDELQYMKDFVSRHPEEMRESFRRFELETKNLFTENVQNSIRQKVDEAGGIDEFTLNSLNTISENLDAEIELFSGYKVIIQEQQAEQPPEKGRKAKTRCALAGVAFGLGVAAAFSGVATGAGVTVAVGAGTYIATNCL